MELFKSFVMAVVSLVMLALLLCFLLALSAPLVLLAAKLGHLFFNVLFTGQLT